MKPADENYPEVILEQPRKQSLKYFIISLVFLIVSIGMISSPREDSNDLFWGWFGLIFMGSLTIVCGVSLFAPRYLKLTPEGLENRVFAGYKLYAKWSDYESFYVAHISAGRAGIQEMVGFRYVEDFHRFGLYRAISKQMTGEASALPAHYGDKSVEELAELLESYRKHYSARHIANQPRPLAYN